MYVPAGYLDLDVLDGLPANEGAVQDGYTRRLEVMDPGPGLMAADARDVAPDWTRAVLWRCTSRAEAAELREFLARRRGRAVPFWLPTFDEDLTLAADALTSVSTLSIVSCGYSDLLFPLGPARRHLALQASPGTPIYRRVTAAVDNRDGTETLTLGVAIDRDLLASRAMISFLRYCRLDDDGPPIDWTGPAYCECVLQVRELVAECPS